MRIIDRKRGQHGWNFLGYTRSNSSAWGFDRFRLFHPNGNTKIALVDYISYISNQNLINPTYGIQKFHSGGGWTTDSFEHDFTFDLSGNVNNDLIMIFISGIPDGAEFQQIYASPTGFSKTRGKNADLYSWDFKNGNTGINVGGFETSIRMDSQTTGLRGLGLDENTKLYATTLKFDDNDLSDFYELDYLIIAADNGGQSNGNLNYSNIGQIPSNASRAAYDSLISRGWTITGTPPPIS